MSSLRVQALYGGRQHVVEWVRTLPLTPTTQRLKDRTRVLGRCLHLHLTQERAEVCLGRLAAMPIADLPAFIQEKVRKRP